MYSAIGLSVNAKVQSMSQRFPAVEKIDPILKPGTLLVDYVVVAQLGRYFNAKHKIAVEKTLRSRIDNIRKVTIKSGTAEAKSRLVVAIDPSDSMAPGGSFVVHDTLQELFQPQVPFVAVAVMRSSILERGDFDLGIQVLGNPSGETLSQLEVEILTTPHTKAVRRDPRDSRHLIATLGGPCSKDLLDEYRNALIAYAGIAATIMVNTKR